MSIRTLLSAAAIAAAVISANAQPATPPPALPPATPGSPQTIPEKTPASPAAPSASGTLTDKLDKSDGVIKPPTGVDPAMAKPAPTAGTMPIVKPPEDKGGPTAK